MFVRKTAGYGDRINPDFAKNIKAANAEEMILGLMLNYEEYRQKAAYDENFINENDFITELGKKIFASVVKLVKEGSYSESLLGIDFTVDEMSRLKQIQIKNSHNNPGNNKAFSDAAAVLKNEKKLFEIKNEKGEDGEDIKVLLDLKRKK